MSPEPAQPTEPEHSTTHEIEALIAEDVQTRPIVIVATVAALVVGALLVFLVDPLRDAVGQALSGDTAELRQDLRDLGAAGIAILYALVLSHTFVWYPSEIVNTAAGFVYGFWGGLALLMIGWTVQGVISWQVGHSLARPVLYRLVGRRRFVEAERLIANGGVTLLLAARLIPIVPFVLFSMVAGAARVPLGRFVWTTFVGYIPLTAMFVYLGSRLEEISPTDPVVLAVAVAVVLLLVIGRWLAPALLRRLPD